MGMFSKKVVENSTSTTNSKKHNNFWLVPKFLEKNAPMLNSITDVEDIWFDEYMSDEEYRSRPEVSNSDLSLIAKWRTGLEHKTSKGTSANYKIGTAFHAYFLEHEKYKGCLDSLSENQKKTVKTLIENAKESNSLTSLLLNKNGKNLYFRFAGLSLSLLLCD